MSQPHQSNETQIALLNQKFDFLTDAVTKLEKTIRDSTESAQRRHDEFTVATQKRHEDFEEEMNALIEHKISAALAKAEPQPQGTIQVLISKPWFGYFIFALLIFGKEVILPLLTSWGGANGK